MQITIDKTIPAPPRHGNTKYPFLTMEVGDSFFTDIPRVSAAAFNAGKKLDRRFACRAAVENGVTGTRVWRLK